MHRALKGLYRVAYQYIPNEGLPAHVSRQQEAMLVYESLTGFFSFSNAQHAR